VNGRVKEFEIYISQDGKAWGEPLVKGVWENDALPKTAFVPRATAAFVKLRGLGEVTGQPFMSAAEIEVLIPKGDAKVASNQN
jgi:hypothetical protein